MERYIIPSGIPVTDRNGVVIGHTTERQEVVGVELLLKMALRAVEDDTLKAFLVLSFEGVTKGDVVFVDRLCGCFTDSRRDIQSQPIIVEAR